MEKRMQEVGVRTGKEGDIQIFQSGLGDEEAIYITADQVEILVQWLQQAKAELEGAKQK
jgi:Holliday junction resolvase